ncbi:hypothetical protein CL634_03835 [bacterium]|nr:hypothetical protein [bacterium]
MKKKVKKSAAKKSPVRKSTAKKVKVLKQTDGMTRDKDDFVPSTLDQVWGDTGENKYKSLDENVYVETIEKMSKSDLKQEAVRVGLLPIDNILQLQGRLKREFRVHVNEYKRPHSWTTRNVGQKKEVSNEVRKILGEGK